MITIKQRRATVPSVSPTEPGWTCDKLETLRSMWAEGATTRTIAEKLGPGFTRNAVIGKAHRLALAKRASPIMRKRVGEK